MLRPIKRLKRALVATALVFLVALLVDRAVLFWWGYRVLSLYHAVERDLPRGSKRTFTEADWKSPPIAGMVLKEASASPVTVVWLSFERTTLRPDRMFVDTSGSLNLFFYPPKAAWTTLLYPRNPNSVYWDKQLYQPKLYYMYRLVVDRGEASGEPRALLYRGLQHSPEPLPRRIRYPEIFP